MGSTKRAWKLNDFVAHGGNVNCLALGHKSGRVMVTGGEDKKVNMWAVGKPNCIMSLSGHTSPIEAVRFSNAEEMVIAGSSSGALKIWDLEHAKIVRTLTGHKSAIKSLDFHTYGDFVASGSLDTNMKLWDIRRKGCIFTYKGHTKCVNCIRFSPDGRWIVTAGEDGVLKMWDLTAGKLITDFKLHSGPVNAVEFHPNEFLLASASSDRTVKFWDLETFQLVSSTDGECTPIKSLYFHPDGMCVYAGAQEQLKVYSWEPAQCLDSISMNWGNVADIAMGINQLIGATCYQSNISTHVVDIQRVQPLGGPVHVPSSPSVPASPMSASGRRSYLTDRPPTQSSKQAPVSPKEEPEEQGGGVDDDPSQNSAEIQDPKDYQEIFHPKSTLSHSPPRQLDPFPAPPDDDSPPEPVQQKPTQKPKITPAAAAAPPPSSQRPAASNSPFQAPPSEPVSKPPVKPQPTKPVSNRQDPTQPTSVRQSAAAVKSPTYSKAPQKQEISADDFLPKQLSPQIGDAGGNAYSNMSESEAISSIMKGHDSMTAVFNSRGKNLQIVRALYTGGNMKTAMDSAIGMNDKAIIVDLLNVLIQRSSLWNLDLCTLAVPQIGDLLSSKYENYVASGCSALKLILKNFGTVIKSNITAPPSVGVDITREERYNKCKACYQQLANIRSQLHDKAALQGKLGTKFKELQLLMGQLD